MSDVAVRDWLLSPDERGNPDTELDRRRPDRQAWSEDNTVRPLVHGRTYFAELCSALEATQRGDLVLFTDWRGDPDEHLQEGLEVSTALCRAASRGVVVKGLVWRSHLDKLQFSGAENRRLGDDIEEAGGEVLLDMRVRPGGSHHQKMVVVRYRQDPGRDVAFVGGIDLCHSRRDDERHLGDPQAQAMPAVYGGRPPWHDIQLAVYGPAVGDVEATFRERWCDPAPLSRSPVRRVTSLIERDDTRADPIPEQGADPGPHGPQVVQVLRTYPWRHDGYPFARAGERSIARAYRKAVARAERFIYLEDQYLWSDEISTVFADALRERPELRMIAVIPLHPDTTGLVAAGETVGRARAIAALRAAAGERFAAYGLENATNDPIYVHAKACVIDDVWTCVGSDNLNIRSWTHDSELSCAVMDADGGTTFGRAFRIELHREHLGQPAAELIKPAEVADAYLRAAADLDGWHDGGRVGPRPPGHLRAYRLPPVAAWQRPLARAAYHFVCDPDGRPPALRRAGAF